MSLYTYRRRPLVRNGRLAAKRTCCCGPTCCLLLPDTMYGQYTNHCASVSVTFHVSDKATLEAIYGTEFRCAGEPYLNGAAPGTLLLISKCWISDEVEITCGESGGGLGGDPVGQSGLCNSTRTGRFILLCGICPGSNDEKLFLRSLDFCFLAETVVLCTPPAPEPACDANSNQACELIRNGEIWSIETKNFPCGGCSNACECESFQVWSA